MIAAGLCVVAAGCRQSRVRDAEQAKAGRDRRASDLAARLDAYRAELKQTAMPPLLERLAADSKNGLEPFNSSVYAEVVSRGQPAGADLARALDSPDANLLALLALRAADLAKYRTIDTATRLRLLLAPLGDGRSALNIYGLPHGRWASVGESVIEEGPRVEPSLRHFLRDKRPVVHWGSETADEVRRYRYRICDYAWAMLVSARGKKPEVPLDPVARDQLINQILGAQK